ncbi:hypothetical protein JCM8202_004946 [Rhodotorula sphaerocarpa]
MANLVIVGGSGKVAKLFSQLAVPAGYAVTSLVRSRDHFDAIKQTGATPALLDLESAGVTQLAETLKEADGVLFAAGAGGKGGKERTKAVDEDGAIKVFDALERISSTKKPYLILVGALDTRDTSQAPPAHYTEKDIEGSKKAHEAIGAYYDAKLAADTNLSRRTTFPWTVVRPGHLLDQEATGQITAGKTGMGGITRADVAASILALFDLALKGSESTSSPAGAGLAIDIIQQGTEGNDLPVTEAIKQAVQKREGSLVV